LTNDDPCEWSRSLLLAGDILLSLNVPLPGYGAAFFRDDRYHALVRTLEGGPPATWRELAQRLKAIMDASPRLAERLGDIHGLLLLRGDTPFEPRFGKLPHDAPSPNPPHVP